MKVVQDTQPNIKGDWIAPRWLVSIARFGYLFLAAILLSTTFLTGCAAQANAPQWQPATDILSEQQVKTIVVEQSSTTAAEATDLVRSAKAFQSDTLVFFDFNSDLLCGRAGCLYLVFHRDDDMSLNPVLGMYLNPYLPPEELSLFEILERTRAGLPCLQINQLEPMEATLTRYEACYDPSSGKYRKVGQQTERVKE